MQRKKTFLVVCISILTVGAYAQSNPPFPVEKIIFTPAFVPILRLPSAQPAQPLNRSPVQPFRLTAVDGSYYSNHLGFFCQKELEIQKVTHLPIFFRLGSLDYVNRLEGK